MNDNVAEPEDQGTTVVGGGFPSRHTADAFIPSNEQGQGKEVHGRGTFGNHLKDRTGPIPETLQSGIGGGEGHSSNVIGGHRGNVDPAAHGSRLDHPTRDQANDSHGGIPPRGPPANDLTGGHHSTPSHGVGVGIGPDARGGLGSSGSQVPSSTHHSTGRDHTSIGHDQHISTTGIASRSGHDHHSTEHGHGNVGIAPPLAKGETTGQTGLSGHGRPTGQGLSGGLQSGHGSHGNTLGHDSSATSGTGAQGFSSTDTHGIGHNTGSHGLGSSGHTGPSLSSSTRQGFENEKQ